MSWQISTKLPHASNARHHLVQGMNNMIQVFYKNKKELKEQIGKSLFYKETSLFGEEYKSNGTFTVADGSPQRKWFATVTMKDNLIAKVK